MKAKIINTYMKKATMEGAGVKLFRVFGSNEIPEFDPFLLLDHFGSNNPDDYMKGFPWHPHRGIETVTYMLNGEVEHGDSLGNKGVIKSGDIQWMTAGSGIIHQEMPKRYKGNMQGFQLWVNLPKKKKMTEPKYRDIQGSSLQKKETSNYSIKVISGKFEDVTGPVQDLAIDIDYFDIELKPKKNMIIPIKKDHNSFIYLIRGSLQIQDSMIEEGTCVLFSKGDEVEIIGEEKSHFLFISGEKLDEPIAWGGPIVMNTDEELRHAFQEIDEGTFIKHEKPKKIAKYYYQD